jgi:hypothetical protein
MNPLSTPLLDDRDLEKRWGKKSGFVSDLRSRGLGPVFLRLSPRTVRYRPEDVLAYEEAQRFGSIAESMTSNYEAPAPMKLDSFSSTFAHLPALPRREPGYKRGPYQKKSRPVLTEKQ